MPTRYRVTIKSKQVAQVDSDHEPLAELLDVIEDLVSTSRAGTFDESPRDYAVWRRARRVLARWGRDA
jgi:hypothetical protein